MPAISIIVPVYNKAAYIEDLLNDIKGQSFSDFECIVVDDGSKDESGSICEKVVREDHRFKLFHLENGGVSRARNFALDRAVGDYITFVDADDRLHKDYLFALHFDIIQYHADLVIGSLVKVWENSNSTELVMSPYVGKYEWESIIEEFSKIQMDTGIYGFCCAKIFSRKVLGELRFNENIKLAEDLDFYLSLYSRINSIYFENRGYYYYLQEADNSSMQKADKDIDYYTQLNIQLKIVHFLKNKGSFIGDNKTIMTNRIYDYVYFCLFHSDLKEIRKRFTCIKELSLPQREKKTHRRINMKHMILNAFEMGRYDIIIVLLGTYRLLRKIIKNRG